MPELRVEEWKGVSQATRALGIFIYFLNIEQVRCLLVTHGGIWQL